MLPTAAALSGDGGDFFPLCGVRATAGRIAIVACRISLKTNGAQRWLCPIYSNPCDGELGRKEPLAFA
jgi:hypothetical protein